MAARKAAPAKAAEKPAEKKPGTDVALWKEELRNRAKAATRVEANVGGQQFIKLRGGQISLGEQVAANNELACVILDHVIEYAMYGGDYDSENPQSPICFAFGDNELELAPHEASQEKQHENCRECPMNKFGSADRGAGKACKNIRRLALIQEKDLDDLDNAQVIFLKVPVTSVKNWAGYVRKLDSSLELPPLAVVTKISTKPHPKHQFEVLFTMEEEIEDGDLIGSLLKMADGVRQELTTPYTSTGDAEEREERPARNNKLSGKTAGRKTPPARGRR